MTDIARFVMRDTSSEHMNARAAMTARNDQKGKEAEYQWIPAHGFASCGKPSPPPTTAQLIAVYCFGKRPIHRKHFLCPRARARRMHQTDMANND